jgi:hypothetical protein
MSGADAVRTDTGRHMIDWKKYRESIGYTQARMSKEAKSWYSLALGYRAAAELLNEFRDRIPRDTRRSHSTRHSQ